MRFRKIGGGTLTLADGRVFKKGEVFEANRVPEAFMDLVEVLDAKEEKKPAERPKTSQGGNEYELHSLGHGWFDVVDRGGNVVNKKKLRKASAMDLITELTGK